SRSELASTPSSHAAPQAIAMSRAYFPCLDRIGTPREGSTPADRVQHGMCHDGVDLARTELCLVARSECVHDVSATDHFLAARDIGDAHSGNVRCRWRGMRGVDRTKIEADAWVPWPLGLRSFSGDRL